MANKKKNKKQKISIIEKIKNSPLQYISIKRLRYKYEELGRPFEIKKLITAVLMAIGLAALYTKTFSLMPICTMMCFIMGIVFAPYFLITDEQCRYEEARFDDINSYMQQLVQGMIIHKRILVSLDEMLKIFPVGQMHDTIAAAVYHIKNNNNFRMAENEALEIIESQYSNPQLETIHDFCMRIEERGGNFDSEMKLLDGVRVRWMKRIQKFQKRLTSVLMFCIVEFIAMAAICAFVLDNMPADMDVTNALSVQIAEVAMLAMFLAILSNIQKKRRNSWLVADSLMNKEDADKLLDYFDFYDAKEERKSGIKMAVLALWGTVLLVTVTKDISIIMIGAVAVGLMVNAHRIKRFINKRILKEEITKAFPSWLFDLCLLIQKDSVPVAITKSALDAPPILVRDILRLDERIKREPASVTAILEFLGEHNINGIKNTMRMIVAILNGNTDNKKLQMEQMISHNLSMIDDRNELQNELDDALINKYYFYPLIPGFITLLVYFVNVIVTVLSSTMTII